jgi:hypothetical protein
VEQHASERVHVGPHLRRLPDDLLGRRIVGRRRAERGQPEVDQASGRAGLVDEQHVPGLDVAMDDPAPVPGSERRRDVLDHRDRGPGPDRAVAPHERAEVDAGHVAHDQEQPAGALAALVDERGAGLGE